VCLDCGKEFPYDWKQMKLVTEHKRESKVTSMAEPARALAKVA
jgi:hypothetical protein